MVWNEGTAEKNKNKRNQKVEGFYNASNALSFLVQEKKNKKRKNLNGSNPASHVVCSVVYDLELYQWQNAVPDRED